MPIRYDIKNRLYKELIQEKDFIAFLKNTNMTKSFIKQYLRQNNDDSNDFGSTKSWCDFEDSKDGEKLFVFVLTHGGFEGNGRLALIYTKESYFLRKLLYWNTQEEKIKPSDIPKIYNQATTLKI